MRSYLTTCVLSAATAAALFAGASTASANLLVNPGFENPVLPGGDIPGAQGWSDFGAAFTIRVAPHTGDQAFKTFGGVSGIFQDFPASAGQQWIGSAWGLNPSFDQLGGAQIGAVNIEWHGAGGLISFDTNAFISAATPAGSLPGDYVFGSITGTAPAGTTFARLVLITGAFAGPGSGSVFFDDASFDQVPEPATLGLLAAIPAFLLKRRRA